MAKTAIVDYGMANLRSVQKACERVGMQSEISNAADTLRSADKMILPGVGAFPDAIERLRQTGLDEVIISFARSGRPILGICLGMQMFFDRSHENGSHDGLGLLPGEAVRFPTLPTIKIPHMGWNTLTIRDQNCPLLRGVADEASVYFVHSYFVQTTDPSIIAADTAYGVIVPAVVWRENVFATQFHPEKSQTVGLTMLRRFADL